MEAPNVVKQKQMKFVGILLGGFVGLLVLGMWLSDPNAGKPSPIEVAQERAKEVSKNYTEPSSAISAEDAWVAKSEEELATLRAEQKLLLEELKKMREEMNGKSGRDPLQDVMGGTSTSDIGMPPAPTIGQLPQQQLAQPQVQPQVQQQLQQPQAQQGQPQQFSELPPPPMPTTAGMPQQQVAGQSGQSIFTVSLSDAANSGEKKSKNIASNLPAGSFATAVLLSGVDAPTGGAAKSNPMPVLIRLMDNGKAPNFWNSGVDNCHVTGAAYGEISSERVHIRPEKVTCVLVNGDIIEEKINGYVTGEDGKAGMRGRLVERQGAMLAKTLFAGIASGGANSINQQYQQVSTSPLGQVSTVDPNKVFEAGMSSGASSALNKLADYYLERANEMYPVIEIDANRIGELVITSGVDMGRNFIGQTREEAEDERNE